MNIQKMPNLIYMQQPEIPLINFDEILQKNYNYVTIPTTKPLKRNATQSYSREMIKR